MQPGENLLDSTVLITVQMFIWRLLFIVPISVIMHIVCFILFTALLYRCCIGVVASQDQQCFVFMSDDSSCPESWHYWGNSCYRVTETIFTWFKARDECRKLGGVLGVPSSNQEREFIAQLIPTDGMVWIDCNDLEVEGRWKCREGNVEIAYRNWDDGEPNSDTDENCVALTKRWGSKGKWHDVKCDKPIPPLCKMAVRPVLHVWQL